MIRAVICIDYDNLTAAHKQAGVLDVVSRILSQLPGLESGGRGRCEVRLYGGWYEQTAMSARAQDVSISVQEDFPAIIRISTGEGEPSRFVTTAELAVSLLEEPSHHLFNTLRIKGKPRNIRVESPAGAGCSLQGCLLPLAKKLLQSGNCPAAGCTTNGATLVYRKEQKIVDTMLTCDLIYLAQKEYDYLVIVSADDDFLPPIRILLLRGVKIIRVHPQLSNALMPVSVSGLQLLELGI